jgi:hypothetical protein
MKTNNLKLIQKITIKAFKLMTGELFMSSRTVDLPEIGIPDVKSPYPASCLGKPSEWIIPFIYKNNGKKSDYIFVKRSNRYLKFKQSLILRHVERNELDKAIGIFFKLMATSRAFRVYSINKVLKG